jgi:hypothetical protein
MSVFIKLSRGVLTRPKHKVRGFVNDHRRRIGAIAGGLCQV